MKFRKIRDSEHTVFTSEVEWPYVSLVPAGVQGVYSIKVTPIGTTEIALLLNGLEYIVPGTYLGSLGTESELLPFSGLVLTLETSGLGPILLGVNSGESPAPSTVNVRIETWRAE